MRVVVAPDKFAGTMSALEAAQAIAEGWQGQRPRDTVRCVPMADGGPGTVDVIHAVAGGRLHRTPTVDQRGAPIEATWLDLDGSTAVVEACSACGLDLVPEQERDPTAMDTSGVGRLLRSVADAGFERIVVGLGGTGTVDGGLGAAAGLGAEVRDGSGGDGAGGPGSYTRIVSVGPISPLTAQVVVATDVTNPLLGDTGAARVFGPQKGAAGPDVDRLERALAHLADVVEGSLPGGPWRDIPGAGAAGGLGFGLMAWAGADVAPGSVLVADMVGLEAHLRWADLVITGEGSLDAQTLAGKAPAQVAEMASEAGIPAVAVAGRIETPAADAFAGVEVLGAEGLSDPRGSAGRAGALLAERIGLIEGGGPGIR